MKKTYILILILPVIFFSCNTDNDNVKSGLTGSWKLTHVLADPGDGSGTFHPVSSEKTIKFHDNGTVTSNGDLCSMSIDHNSSSDGTYSLTDSTIYHNDCKIYFELSANELILNFQCIEPCKAKFKKQ